MRDLQGILTFQGRLNNLNKKPYQKVSGKLQLYCCHERYMNTIMKLLVGKDNLKEQLLGHVIWCPMDIVDEKFLCCSLNLGLVS